MSETSSVSRFQIDRKTLLNMSSRELGQLFAAGRAGPMPEGAGTGTALVPAAGWLERLLAFFVRLFLWQGKVFDATRGQLVNRITLLGLRAIRARTYQQPSWVDGRPCIVIDYARTSLVARFVRDEMREVAPGLYLGPVFVGRRRTIFFALDFQNRACRSAWPGLARVVATGMLLLAGYLAYRLNIDRPVTYDSPELHFRYGSTGGERASGIPHAIWKVLPALCSEHLPGPGYESFGFIFEPDKDLPIGVSRRNVQGLDRVFFNCAVCHAGTVRAAPDAGRTIYSAMPANTVDLQAFQDFLFRCAADADFTPQRLLLEIEAGGERLDPINRLALRHYGVQLMRERLLTVADLFDFAGREPRLGPGRVDTFNPPKALLNFPMDKVPASEWIGIADLPSIWLQGKRRGMQLHWDGSNDLMEERNLSAAYGTGAFPSTIDRPSLKRMEEYLLTVEPPAYPFAIDRVRAARGAAIYRVTCAGCHGQNGRDFSGDRVGKVTPIAEIGTDRHRLDSYSPELCAAQNTLYAGYPERFSHFRKTFGYANMPLDGIWLRAPYLHNGSVPTLRELEPRERRRPFFHRGYDVYDQQRVGFMADRASEGWRRYFPVDASTPGNGNAGHEGAAYGTALSDPDKDALVEFLKTF